MAVRFIFCVAVCFLFFDLSAQIKFGVFAGPQKTSAHYTVNENLQPATYQYGAQAGMNLKIPFEGILSFSPHLYYSMKGYKVTLNDPSYPPSVYAINNHTKIHTVDIAPLFNIDFSLKPTHLFIRFGPSIDVVISGKEKFEKDNGEIVEQSMPFSFADYGRITASAIVHLGFEHQNGFYIYGHYAHGIGSMNNADFGPKINHRIFGISIGKYFGRDPNFIDTRVKE